MNGDGTLAAPVTKKADAGEFVVRTFSPSLLRMQINRLNLWREKPYVPLDVLVGYFSQYVYMPKVVQPKVVIDAVWHLDDALVVELDGFAYADSYEDGRFSGLTMRTPSAVRQGGLLVDPVVATQQIEADTRGGEDESDGDEAGESSAGRSDTSSTGTGSGSSGSATSSGGGRSAAPVPTRFHATKDLTVNRVVRDAGQIYEEIVSHFVTAGVPVRVTIDIESEQLAKLSDDQRSAIRENLKTLGFGDDDWSMD